MRGKTVKRIRKICVGLNPRAYRRVKKQFNKLPWHDRHLILETGSKHVTAALSAIEG